MKTWYRHNLNTKSHKVAGNAKPTKKSKTEKKTNLLDTSWTQHWSTLEVACAQLGRSFHWNRSTLTTQCIIYSTSMIINVHFMNHNDKISVNFFSIHLSSFPFGYLSPNPNRPTASHPRLGWLTPQAMHPGEVILWRWDDQKEISQKQKFCHIFSVKWCKQQHQSTAFWHLPKLLSWFWTCFSLHSQGYPWLYNQVVSEETHWTDLKSPKQALLASCETA